MDNIDKTFILSYPRTGSTALLDVYRIYLENKYRDRYINMPDEVATWEHFHNTTDYKGEGYPFNKFYEKHNFPVIHLNNLLEFNQNGFENLYKKFFQAILSEPFFATKIFPNLISSYPDFITNVLIKHVKEDNNLICLYRRNFLDTLSSIIACTWSNYWVHGIHKISSHPKITADMVELDSEQCFSSIKNQFINLKIWYQCCLSIKRECNSIKFIAYEDIKSFDTNVLFDLHNIKLDYTSKCRIVAQHNREEQNKIIEKYWHLIEKAASEVNFKDLPLNSSYEVIL